MLKYVLQSYSVDLVRSAIVATAMLVYAMFVYEEQRGELNSFATFLNYQDQTVERK